MENRIKIANLISTDVRSRNNAKKIREEIESTLNDYVLDFSEVIFVSRSFTDELYSIIEHFSNIRLEITNTSTIVKNMMDAVKNSRSKKRVRPTKESDIKNFEDFESLSKFLSTIN